MPARRPSFAPSPGVIGPGVPLLYTKTARNPPSSAQRKQHMPRIGTRPSIALSTPATAPPIIAAFILLSISSHPSYSIVLELIAEPFNLAPALGRAGLRADGTPRRTSLQNPARRRRRRRRPPEAPS